MIKIMGIGMIFRNIKDIVICLLILVGVVFSTCLTSYAIQDEEKLPVVTVVSDTNHRNGTTYLICGAASDIIASDIINRLNNTGRIKAPLLGESMSRFASNFPVYTNTFFKEYKYNYNVDFINLKRLTRNLETDYVLMVTSGLDIQSQFLKETWWNKWGISSSEPLQPTYRLVTMVTLVDMKSYRIVWQDLYEKNIKAENLDIGITQFSPNYSQLAKIKRYSAVMSEYVANSVEKNINKSIFFAKKSRAVEIKSSFINEDKKIYYPVVNGEVVKENLEGLKDFANESKSKWKNYQQDRKRNKSIENVSSVKKQVQQKASKQNLETKKQKIDDKLFESIRDNVDEFSNSLPEVKDEKQEVILPAVDVKPVDEVAEPKVLKPIVEIQNSENKTQENILENVDKTLDKNIIPAVHKHEVKEQKPLLDTEEKGVLPQVEQPKNRVPRYDWNLKNIYLQKIGHV